MKLLFFILLALNLSAQKYCVQVCATRNPELLKPEMISILPDTAMVEQSGEWFRILFVYDSYEEAMVMHTSWLKQWSGAIIVKRDEKQILKLTKLFSEI